MIVDRPITIRTAKLAREKGFNLYSPAFYGCDEPHGGGPPNSFMQKTWYRPEDVDREETQEGTMCYEAPTQNMLKTWLRRKFHLNVHVACNSITTYFPMIELLEVGGTQLKGPAYDKNYKEYEDALEVGLFEALKLIQIP